MKKIGIAILCRYNSSRLPGKILKEIEEKPILQHIYQRLAKVLPSNELVVATSSEATDNPIADFCSENKINCFRGSLNNVAQRFLNVALHYEWDYIIRINGDNLFIDIETIQEMLDICRAKDYDFISNVAGRTFPFGMSIEIVKTSFYQDLLKKMDEDRYFEHVTLYLYENQDLGKQLHLKNTKCPEMKGYKLAVDEAKDFEFAKGLMQELKSNNYEYNLNSLYEIIQKNL